LTFILASTNSIPNPRKPPWGSILEVFWRRQVWRSRVSSAFPSSGLSPANCAGRTTPPTSIPRTTPRDRLGLRPAARISLSRAGEGRGRAAGEVAPPSLAVDALRKERGLHQRAADPRRDRRRLRAGPRHAYRILRPASGRRRARMRVASDVGAIISSSSAAPSMRRRSPRRSPPESASSPSVSGGVATTRPTERSRSSWRSAPMRTSRACRRPSARKPIDSSCSSHAAMTS
jgi:hypothetical protein